MRNKLLKSKLNKEFFVHFSEGYELNFSPEGYLPFDAKMADAYLKKLLRHYKIKVRSWSKGPNGRAWVDDKEIKIPHPTNIENFCVAMHEIGHVVKDASKTKMKLYQSEYIAEMFAFEQAELFKWDAREYRERARWYIIMNISKGYCRKLNLDTIEKEIRDFCAIDFNEWKGKKVFVSRHPNPNECKIIFN